MIDLHAHILPAIDDGPPTTEAALAMARTATAAGTRAIATTSHVAHVFSLDPEQIVHGREMLAARLAYEGIELELLSGGEIAHDRLPELDDETLQTLTLGGGPYLLLECPFAPIGDGLEPLVDDLHERGFEVLLAHPERSASFQQDPDLLAALVDQGALAQVTVGSLTGHFGRIPQRTAEMMVREGLVHVLASDAHDIAGRAPVLHANGALTADQYERMTTVVPEAIVAGQPVRAS
ncbi:MAG TPA: CpsB/CapC family capsule biosynthesis tyrosine phosphatase [Solirubrobacteraceae bacterium]|nr:CpsB/CapC family capsule biosynthesis tyrosine phosphatase [Solirubrobacteraceae bacterium]